MRSFFALAILTLVSAGTIAAQDAPSQQLPSVDLSPELERVLRDYEAAWSARDHSTYAFYREPISELLFRNETAENRHALDIIAEGATVVYD